MCVCEWLSALAQPERRLCDCKCSSIRNYIEGGTITAAGTEFCHSCVDIFASFFSAISCPLAKGQRLRIVQKDVTGGGEEFRVLLLKFVCVDFVVVCPFGIASLSVIKCRQTENQVTHTPR